MADISYRNAPDGGDLAAALRALPLASPDRSEWPRVAEALAQRARHRRQQRYAIGVAAAAVLALAFGLGRLQLAPPAADSQALAGRAEQPQADATAALIARNQELQAMLRGFDVRSAPMDGEAALASARLEDLIAMLDVELGDAAEGEAADALWEQRLVLLQELASMRQQGQAAVVQQDGGAGLVPASWIVD